MKDVTTSVMLNSIYEYQTAFIKIYAVLDSNIRNASLQHDNEHIHTYTECKEIVQQFDPDFKEDK